MLDYYSMINYREVLYKKEVHYIIAIVDNLLQAYKKNKPEDHFRLITKSCKWLK